MILHDKIYLHIKCSSQLYIYIYIYEMSSNYMWCNLIRVARFFNRSSLFDLTVNNHFLPVINKSKLFFIHKNSLLSLSLSLSPCSLSATSSSALLALYFHFNSPLQFSQMLSFFCILYEYNHQKIQNPKICL